MSTIIEPLSRPQPAEADPYRYGWRYVREELPDGRVTFQQRPLTLEAVLHPEEEDFHVRGTVHDDDCIYLCNVMDVRIANIPDGVVLHDCRIAWDVVGIRPLGPDIALIFGVRHRGPWSTFDVAREGVRPVLIIEVVSPETRQNDIVAKVDLYYRVRIPFYVVIDRPQGDRGPVQLLGYRHTPAGYEPMPLDDQGRLFLQPVNLFLGVKDQRAVLYDAATGKEYGDYTKVSQELAAAAEQQKTAEDRIRQLEAELRRLRGEANGK